jgi:hypothetical protein
LWFVYANAIGKFSPISFIQNLRTPQCCLPSFIVSCISSAVIPISFQTFNLFFVLPVFIFLRNSLFFLFCFVNKFLFRFKDAVLRRWAPAHSSDSDLLPSTESKTTLHSYKIRNIKINHSFIPRPFIHKFILKSDPQPLPKRVLHTV